MALSRMRYERVVQRDTWKQKQRRGVRAKHASRCAVRLRLPACSVFCSFAAHFRFHHRRWFRYAAFSPIILCLMPPLYSMPPVFAAIYVMSPLAATMMPLLPAASIAPRAYACERASSRERYTVQHASAPRSRLRSAMCRISIDESRQCTQRRNDGCRAHGVMRELCSRVMPAVCAAPRQRTP